MTEHRRLLDMKDVDAVIIASPLHCHARHFIDGLAAGKDLYSEKTMTLVSETKDVQHLQNFLDCVRSRKEPTAPVELGYRTAVAAHLANLAYRQKDRVTFPARTSTSEARKN